MARNTSRRTLNWLATRAFTTLNTRILMALALASMSAIVAAQAPSTRDMPMQRMVNPQILKVSDAYTRAILAGDARGLAAFFTIDGYLMPPHVPAVKGQAAIQQGYETLFRGPAKITEFALSHLETVTEGDLAYSVATYTQRLSLPDGKTVGDTGKSIAILKRVQGEWKLAYLTYNSDLPSMPCSSSK